MTCSPAPPPGWGDDEISKYLDTARGNQLATFHKKREVMADLIKVDSLLRKLLAGAINLRPHAPASFLLRAHSAFLAAAGMVMAGQLVEAQAVMRQCLESAGYAFYIGSNDARWEAWLRRHDSPANQKAVRDEFQHRKIADTIKATAPKIGGPYADLYERVIDFGAHPNERGFSTSTQIVEDDDRTHYLSVYLHKDGLPLDLALKTLTTIGITVALIARLIYPARFELLQLSPPLDELWKRF